MKLASILLITMMLLFSCTTQEVCDGEGQSEMVVRLKTEDAGAVVDTIVSGVTLYGIRDGLADSLLYDGSTISRILLPLDPNHDFSRFILQVNDQVDTLKIFHRTEFYMISYSCGFASIFTLNDIRYSGPLIQNHEIINEVIDAELEQNEEHLWLYF